MNRSGKWLFYVVITSGFSRIARWMDVSFLTSVLTNNGAENMAHIVNSVRYCHIKEQPHRDRQSGLSAQHKPVPT